jgi:penicillin-binding protein 1A
VANNKSRQETILWEMYDQGYISHDEYVEAINEQLKFVRSESSETEQYIYSYYEETVIEDVLQDLMAQKGVNRDTAWDMLTEGGYQIYSCYDPKVQKAVDDVYTNVDGLPKAYRQPSPNQDGSIPQLQSAIMVMEPTSGQVVAMSGGTGSKDANFILNRATGALRTPGSAFKPLASYGPAMEYGLITASTEINDSPDVKLNGTSWYPHNTPDRYDGWITIQQALAQSKNTAAAQIIDKLTPQTSFDFITTRLGFESLIPEDADYVAMALGDMHYGVTVREMTQAYCAFMNEGTFTYSRTYTKVVDPTGSIVLDNSPETIQAFSTSTANNMVALLRNNVTNGIAGAARLNNMPSAGKTGTASNNKNRYFAGFTPYYTAAVWTGYDENQTMSFSGNPALDIWKAVMNNITVNKGLEYKELPTGSYQKPTGIFGSKEDEVEPTPTPTPSAEPTPEATVTPPPTPSPPADTPAPPVTEPSEDPNAPPVD